MRCLSLKVYGVNRFELKGFNVAENSFFEGQLTSIGNGNKITVAEKSAGGTQVYVIVL